MRAVVATQPQLARQARGAAARAPPTGPPFAPWSLGSDAPWPPPRPRRRRRWRWRHRRGPLSHLLHRRLERSQLRRARLHRRYMPGHACGAPVLWLAHSAVIPLGGILTDVYFMVSIWLCYRYAEVSRCRGLLDHSLLSPSRTRCADCRQPGPPAQCFACVSLGLFLPRLCFGRCTFPVGFSVRGVCPCWCAL